MKISRKTKNNLLHAVLASTVFSLSSPIVHAACSASPAFTNISGNQNIPPNPGSGGYNFTANGASLTVTGVTTVDFSVENSVNVALDNNCGGTSGYSGTSLILNAGVIVDGVVGYSNPIGSITANLGGATTIATFNGDVDLGTGSLTFQSDGTIELNQQTGPMTFTGNINSAGAYTTEIDIFSPDTTTITGSIGASNSITTLNLPLDNNTSLEVNGSTLAADTTNYSGAAANTLYLHNTAGGMNVTTALVSPNDDTGILSINNNGTTNFTGDIGDSTNALSLVKINGSSPQTVNMTGNIYAYTLTFLNNSTLTLGDTTNTTSYVISGNITTSAANQGNLTLTGQANSEGVEIKGNVGTQPYPLKQINIAAAGTGAEIFFDKNIAAQTMVFSGTAPIAVMNSSYAVIIGAVDNITQSNLSDLAYYQSGIITGSVGTTYPINLILVNAGSSSTASLELNGSTIQANTIQLLDGNNTGQETSLDLFAPGNMNITANVTSATDDTDYLYIYNSGNTTFTGDVGQSATPYFHLVDIGPNDTSATNQITFNGNIYSYLTSFEGDQNLIMADGTTIAGDVYTNNNFEGNLTLGTGASIAGGVGISGNSLNSVNLAGTGTYTFANDFRAYSLNFTDNADNTTTADFTSNNFPLIEQIANKTTTQYIGNVILDGTGSFTFTDTIGSQALPINRLTLNVAGISVEFEKNVYVGNYNSNNGGIIFNADDSITVDDNVHISGTISNQSGTPSEGTVTFLGTGSIDSAIGGSSATDVLKLVDINGPAGSTVQLLADISATDVNVDNGGTFAVSGPHTIDGNLTVTNSSVLSLQPNVEPLTVTQTFTISGNDTLEVDMQNYNVGEIDAGNAQVLGGQVTIVNPALFPIGTNKQALVTGGAGSIITELDVTDSDTLLQHYSTFADNINHILYLVITTSSTASFSGGLPNTQGVAGALDAIESTGNFPPGALGDIINEAFFEITDAGVLLRGLETLAPIVDGAIVTESFNSQRLAFEQVEDRLDQVGFGFVRPLASHHSGYAAGDMQQLPLDSPATWVKVYGQDARQRERQGIPGYKDNTWGIAGGADTMLSEQALLGASLSWSGMHLYHEISDSRTKTWSLQGSLYGSYYFDNPLFLKWSGGVAYNNYLTHRNVYFGDIYLTPRGQYHAWQTGAKAEMGYVCGKHDLHLVPLASLFYSHLALSSYTETQADTADQEFQRESFDTLLGGVGAKFVYDYEFTQYDMSTIQPDFHVMAFYDFINDQMETTSQFTGGGPSFVTQGFTPARVSYNVGAGITAFSTSGVVLSANYDFNVKPQYRAHAGLLKFRYEW